MNENGHDEIVSEEPRAPFPRQGRLLGVDFGAVRIGLSVCDTEQKIASPLVTYQRQDARRDASYFAKLAREQNAVGWVVGLALLINGDEGPKAKECRAFGQWLGSETQLPVTFYDERCTTLAAEESLWMAGMTHDKRRDRRDRVAAQLILQSYLDAQPAI